MPEIDADLFQLIALALLVLLVVLALLILNALQKLKDQPAQQQRSAGEAPAAAAQGYPAAATQSSYAPADATPAYAQPQTFADPAASFGAPAATEVSQGAAPSQASGAQETGTAFEPVPSHAATAPRAEEVPEEQPFEREGRWWFKRGDELLVYDEQSGQWQPAPAGALGGLMDGGGGGGGASGGGAPATGYGSSSGAGAEAGAGWKCPSCGAVNGSTATTCRMCFAARP